MPAILTYLFAAVGAWCLYSPHGFLWLVPALLLVAAASFTQGRNVAGWTVAGFAGLLAFWSVWAFRHAQRADGVGLIILGLTPMMQLFAMVALLVPLLLGQRIHRRPPGPTTRFDEPPPQGQR